MFCCSCCSFDEEKKKKKKNKKINNLQNLRSIYKLSSYKKESMFSWVVSCMAIVELQFGIICAFFAKHLPYHLYRK